MLLFSISLKVLTKYNPVHSTDDCSISHLGELCILRKMVQKLIYKPITLSRAIHFLNCQMENSQSNDLHTCIGSRVHFFLPNIITPLNSESPRHQTQRDCSWKQGLVVQTQMFMFHKWPEKSSVSSWETARLFVHTHTHPHAHMCILHIYMYTVHKHLWKWLFTNFKTFFCNICVTLIRTFLATEKLGLDIAFLFLEFILCF